MCRIDCSGGCPECSPEDHIDRCALQWGETHLCTCHVEDGEEGEEFYEDDS